MLPIITDSIAVSGFAKSRHTPEERFSDFPEMSWDQVISLVYQAVSKGNMSKGYREGVVEVSVPPEGFRSNVVLLQPGDQLSGTFEARREGEAPRKSLGTPERRKSPAKSVLVILYARSVLEESGEETTGADWEIVTVNAAATLEREPIHPDVLFHNHFGADGGTATGMSDSEFVAACRESYEYWRDKEACR